MHVDGNKEHCCHHKNSIWHSLPTLQRSCHSFATKSACSWGWTANPFASTDASAHGATCLIQRRASQAPSAIAVVEAQSFHARARVRDATSSIWQASCSLASVHGARRLHQLFHQLHIAGGSYEKYHRKLQILRRMSQMTLQLLVKGWLRKRAAQRSGASLQQIPQRRFT